MGLLSNKMISITFGTGGTAPSISRANYTGPLAANTPPSGVNTDAGNGLWANCDFGAVKVWNAVWNDLADNQLLADELIYGLCYYDTPEGAKICNTRCQKGVIGIASNTYGMSLGKSAHQNEVPIGIAGWVLAFVDQSYPTGTPLTNNGKGELTKMSFIEKLLYPERLLATYKKKENNAFFGPIDSQVEVKGRHWVKIK